MKESDIEDRYHPFDTNVEILPAKRTKDTPAGPPVEEKKISKRKQRKLDQLAQKKASKELRTEVLKELKSVQLSQEQSLLMRASQSSKMTRRDTVALAKRRMAMGVPLSADMKRLRRHKSTEERQDKLSSSEEDAITGGESAAALPGPRSPPPLASPATCNLGNAPRAATLSNKVSLPPAQPPHGGTSTAVVEKAELPAKKTASSLAAAAAAAADHVKKAVVGVEPRQRVHVLRTTEIEEQRSKLPALMVEQEIVETILENDVTLICGDTGCGKSTQVPQFLYEAGLCNDGRYLIGVTQPRRVAAISVSQRVGHELNEPGAVGYQVRYEKSHCSERTRIKFMTDGILLREVQADFLCRKYAAIVIDEAHERGVNCDILIGLLSRAAQRRRHDYDQAVANGLFDRSSEGTGGLKTQSELPPPPLRIVIMSATLRVCDFTENRQLFSIPPPVVRIDARMFPVTVHFARSTEDDYIKAAHRSVLQIHKQLPPGTILVFVTGRQEVHRLCRLLRQSSTKRWSTNAAQDANSSAEADICDDVGGDIELLEASDDEGQDFDDTLEIRTAGSGKPPPKRKAETRVCKQKKKRVDDGIVNVKEADTTSDVTKRKRRRKTQTTTESKTPELEQSGVVAVSGSRKGKKRTGSARKSKQRAPEVPTHGLEKELEEECDVSFKIDEEEDTVVLDPEPSAAAMEDAKDAEARRQKKIRMSKLDRSRTANGAYKGSGFNEGPMLVLPLYAQLPAREQLVPFAPPPEDKRVVVVATNVAETSVTIPNVRYVVDAGREKRRKYRAASGISAFSVDHISKASADQRAGRAGRLGPGHSYRLYSAAAYENHFCKFAPIAMLHTPMDPVLLLLASIGVPRLDLFAWPTPPPPDAVSAAIRRLQILGAIAEESGAPGARDAKVVRCTPLGMRLAAIPVAPRFARMLLASVSASQKLDEHIIGHACAIVAALSVGNITCWESAGIGDDEMEHSDSMDELLRAQREAQKQLRNAQQRNAPQWSKLRDDMDGLLWLMGGYAWAQGKGEEAADRFCQSNRANPRQIAEAHSLMQQLGSLLQRRLSLEDMGVTLELPLRPKPLKEIPAQRLRECIVEGLLDRLAVRSPDHGQHAYVCADLGAQTPIYPHCSSNIFRYRPHPTVLGFNEVIKSSKPFMRDCVSIDPVYLARQAAMGGCSLLKLGELLPIPAPRYLTEQDSVMAFVSPSYAPLSYTLPTVEVNVPRDLIFRYKVFAKALLEGEVISGFPPRNVQLLARPAIVLSVPNNPRVLHIVGPLWEHRVGSRADLQRRWAIDRRFLLDGYLRWLPVGVHDDVQAAWPPSTQRLPR